MAGQLDTPFRPQQLHRLWNAQPPVVRQAPRQHGELGLDDHQGGYQRAGGEGALGGGSYSVDVDHVDHPSGYANLGVGGASIDRILPMTRPLVFHSPECRCAIDLLCLYRLLPRSRPPVAARRCCGSRLSACRSCPTSILWARATRTASSPSRASTLTYDVRRRLGGGKTVRPFVI